MNAFHVTGYLAWVDAACDAPCLTHFVPVSDPAGAQVLGVICKTTPREVPWPAAGESRRTLVCELETHRCLREDLLFRAFRSPLIRLVGAGRPATYLVVTEHPPRGRVAPAKVLLDADPGAADPET